MAGHVADTAAEPLVVTLVLDAATTARFGAERRELFPRGRTEVGAHLTLFHAVPGDRLARVRDDLRSGADRDVFALAVTEVMPLGRGAAYRIEAAELAALHERLQRSWWDRLTRQDRQPLRPHVTVQNEVAPEVATSTVARLREEFSPFTARALGLALWAYAGGPWRALETYAFVDAPR